MTIDSAHPGMGLKNRKILIVADDHSKVLSLREILVLDGYDVVSVSSGGAALDYYNQYEPDLVLLDAGLPGSNVFEVCRALKNPYSGAPATVIFITSKSEPEEVVSGLASGGVDYLARPFREREVLARVRVHLRNRLRLVQMYKDERAKDRLLCMTAHDLRNPATSIRALVHTLRSGSAGPLAAEQVDMLNTVYEASQSMLDLVNTLLDNSLIDASEMKINRQPTSLSDLVEEAVKLNSATAAMKGSRIVLSGGPLPGLLSIDGPRISSVLNNLLGNAVKFSPPGSTITVEQRCADGKCSVSFRDQGPGIPDDEHDKLFKEYGRTSVRPTGGEPSTGLGLSICHQVMLAHGGTILAENLAGGGAEFRITFQAKT
jgi:two-component system, sensor histidine kinase and response regulator